jgi:hypothetical protein
MNERIRELMLKSGYAAPEVAGRAQVLAELIVRECVAVIEPGEFMQGTAHNDTKKIIALNQRKIRKHFGVDE